MVKYLTNIALGVIIAMALAFALSNPPPALGATPQQCAGPTADQVFAAIAKDGGEIIGAMPYKGKLSDQAIIYKDGGKIILFLLNGGCMASAPLGLDEVEGEV